MSRTNAQTYDCSLRFMVPSRSHPGQAHLVQLDSYNCNGSCVCEHFLCRLEPLLKRGMKPDAAVAMKKVRRREGVRIEDALRCEHIREARNQLCDQLVKAIHEKEQENAALQRR